MFAMLGSLGGVEDARVADLFAGTGALGIEALSRGARHVTFVDHDRTAIATIRANLDATGLAGDRAAVVACDVERWLRAAAPVDVALLDPPYAFDGWLRLLSRLRADLAICESAHEIDVADRGEVGRR